MRIVILGNSGSGKSTLAKKIEKNHSASCLDLDTVAWQKTTPPKRKNIETSKTEIESFIKNNKNWVVEGCYSSLIPFALEHCDTFIFLNPGFEVCVENCRKRPWEPHKYDSPEEQDSNIDMLIAWVQRYSYREDEFSLSQHRKLFNGFKGYKREYKIAPNNLFEAGNTPGISAT